MARRRLEAADVSPASLIGIILVPVGLLLLAIAAAGVYTLINDDFAVWVAENSSCNDSSCDASEIRGFALIEIPMTGLTGLFLIIIGLASFGGGRTIDLSRLRGGRSGSPIPPASPSATPTPTPQ